MTTKSSQDLHDLSLEIPSLPLKVYHCILDLLRQPPPDAPSGWLGDFAGLPDQLFNKGFLEEALTLCRLTRHRQGPRLALRRTPYVNDVPLDRIDLMRREYNRLYAMPVPRQPQMRQIDRSRPLRVGHLINSTEYSSAEYFLTAERRLHDRRRVQLFHYHHQGEGSTARHPQDVWVNARSLSNEQLFDRIVADGVDILVDLCDINAGSRLSVLATRAAPVQINRAGIISSQLPTMDWRLLDPVIDGQGLRETLSERRFSLPCMFVFEAPPEAPPPSARRPDPTALRFGVFCQPGKIRPAAARIWAEILRARPGATLWLKRTEYASPDALGRVRSMLTDAGIPAERLRFQGWSEKGDHMADYAQVDLCLDTFPFGGHTTTCEALWMGTPTVGLLGETVAARMGPAYLHAAGCGDWIARDADDYVRIALDLTADTDRLHEIRQGLRAQVAASTLCDGVGYTRALEDAYDMMAEDANRRWSGV